MILCIGEILADIIGEKSDGNLSLKAFCGGAPFNVAVNAAQSGAKVGFIGRVGSDPIGRFLSESAKRAPLDFIEIQTDDHRNTTLAFVTIDNGERDFSFFRNDTADYHLRAEDLSEEKLLPYGIVHLGSLMLSKKEGRAYAKEAVKIIKNAGKLLSFDLNYRADLFADFLTARRALSPLVKAADILKFSEDEIVAFTDETDLNKAIDKVKSKNKLILVTLGDKGSICDYNGYREFFSTEKVVPVDTTGAGDAFFGTVLARLDGKSFTEENIAAAVNAGNAAGAKATQFKGAVKL